MFIGVKRVFMFLVGSKSLRSGVVLFPAACRRFSVVDWCGGEEECWFQFFKCGNECALFYLGGVGGFDIGWEEKQNKVENVDNFCLHCVQGTIVCYAVRKDLKFCAPRDQV